MQTGIEQVLDIFPACRSVVGVFAILLVDLGAGHEFGPADLGGAGVFVVFVEFETRVLEIA